MSTLRRITIRSALDTRCPQGGVDENEVCVSWRPLSQRPLVQAEAVHTAVAALRDEEFYCEHLALELARNLEQLVKRPVTVVVRQYSGHGVEAEATSP